MKFQIATNSRNKDINYIVLPIEILGSWDIITSCPNVSIYYYFYLRSGYTYGSVIPVIISYTNKRNIIYYQYDHRIVPINTRDNDFILFDTPSECMEYGINYWLSHFEKLCKVTVNSDISLSINHNRLTKIYNSFLTDLEQLNNNQITKSFKILYK